MTSPIRVLGFSGSLRKGSYNAGLLRAAAGLLPEGMTLETFDLAPVPLFNEDILTAGAPEPVREFKARIAAADALLIATPEYNYSIPGVLKNAIDWASRPLNGPEVMIQRSWEKFDANGNLTDEPSRQQVRALLEALAAWTRRLKGG